MKRATVAALLSGLIALLTLGLSGCGSSTQPISVTLTPSSTQSIDQAQTVAITAGVAHDAKNGGVTWGVSGGGTLTGSTTTSATYNAPASVTSAFTATVTATSVTDTTKLATLQIKVSPPPAITTTSLTVTEGSAYNGTLSESGGTSPYSWAMTAGTLPTGLSFNTGTGAVTGMPTGPSGNSSVTFKITDAAKMSASQAVAITVNAPPPLTITTASPLPAGVMGTAYSQTLQATGGVPTYMWSSGALPAGLSLNASTGVISGTPTGTFTGTTTFTVTATDSQTPTHATTTASLSITVSAPTLKVTTTSLPGGSIGTAYSQTLQASGGAGAYTWAVTTGSLPVGLTLNAATGVISGTPSGNFVGAVNFTVTVTDAETPTPQKASQALSITISVAPLSVTTTSGSLPTGVVNTLYPSTTLQATGGITPYTWSYTGTLPPGLTLSAAGVIAGTPTSAGTFNFTVTVTDAETPTPQKANASLSITVNAQLAVTTTSLAAGVIGTSYSQTLAATGGITPYSWAITTGSLPAGLTLNAATGVISGTPSGNVTGTDTFTVTVTDNESPTKKTASATLSITITAPTLSVTTTSLPGGSIGTPYSQTLAATGGITPYTWAVTAGALPAGLTLNAATGVISGTPSGDFVGAVNFTVTVTDAETPTPQKASQALSITISVAPLSVTTTSGSLPTGVVNTLYPSTTLQATGGITPYTWSYTGTLPPGLTLSAAGVIAGTPTSAGTFNFTVTVTDAETPTPQKANASLSITVNAQLAVTTTSLAAGVIGTSYSQTLAATGGITPYSWAITTGSLPAGLTLNAATGVISGTPSGNVTGTDTFTVTVTDSESPTKKTASATLSITITAPKLVVTTTSLPTGVTGNTYSATLQASGGVPSYTWSLINGTSLPPGLSLTSTGCGSNVNCAITGTPTQTGTFSFTVQVTDSETPTAQTAIANLSITVNNSAPLTITTTGLPQGVINTPYQNAVLTASGGVQPYMWSISGGSLPAWATLNASTGAITGTPNATGTTNFTVKVTDSSSPANTATAPLSITINAALTITTTAIPNGSVGAQYSATVNASGGLQPYSWSIISGSLPPGLNYNNNNNSLNISGTPTTTDTYTFTVQVTDNQGDTASQQFTIVIGTQPVGYTVSGTVSYGGSKTGFVYLQLNSNNCGGCNNNLGTSISEATLKSGGAFTIHGVQPGTYTLQVFMDNLGYGAENASNPTGSVSNVTVVNANVSGVGVTLADPGAVTLSSGPNWQGGSAFSGGAFVTFKTITNNNGIEMPASYTVEWSTSSSFSGTPGSMTFPAVGNNNPWIVTGLTNGTAYYFRAQGVAGSSTSSWVESPSAITIGAPSGGNSVSGTVTFSQTAAGPLYVGFYDQNTGNIYAEQVGSKANPPKSPASYSVSVPDGSNYYFFGVLDQKNAGLVGGPGEVSNVNENNNNSVVINGPLSGEDLTLPSSNSIAFIRTQVQEQLNGSNTINYSIGFEVDGQFKLPVAVEITTESNPGVVIPADIANGAFGSSKADRFSFWTSTNGFTPQVGDSYTLNVTYSDGTSENLTASVTAVLNDAFVTNLVPQGSGVSVTPNFSWTDPTGGSNYTYQFWLCCDQQGTIWQIPSNNSNSNGFPYTITSITWGVDPTNPSNDLPPGFSLNGLTNYSWQIQATDVNGNSAQVQANFETASTPLTLPPAGSVGTDVVGQNFNGAINASGGVPNYSFTVNGSPVPTNGTPVELGTSGLYVSNTGGNTLSISGTPSSTGTVSFTVSVTDSEPVTVGPYTYTITVTPAQALSIQTTALPGALDGWAYNTYIQANGGVQPYTWSIISGGSSLTALGLTFTNNPQNNNNEAEISGTPTATGTASFTVQVVDNEGTTLTQSLSIAVTGCTNNSSLSGTYAMLLQGWSDSGSGEVFTGLAGSVAANGSGTITGGIADFNDPADGYSEVTIDSSTYCVASNNQGLMNINSTAGSLTLAFALQSSGNGNIIIYQTGQGFQGSGVLLKQTTSAFSLSKITGPYAVGLIGVDQGGNRFGVAGAFTANGSADWTNGQLDANDNGKVNGGNGIGSPITFSSNDVSTVNTTTGRGTVGIDVTGVGTLNFAYYVVNATQLLLVQTDPISGPGGSLFAGQILQQSGTFTNASLDGVSVLEAQGLDSGNPVATAGFVTTTGASATYSFSGDQNDGGTEETQSDTGTFSVASNGRTTLASSGGGNSPLLYLIAKNQALLLNTNSKVSFGMLIPQEAITFSDSSVSGNYLGGSEQPVNSNVKAGVIQLDASGTGAVTGTQYQVENCGSGCWEPESQTLQSITYAPDPDGLNGKFDISQDGQVGVYLYMISTTQGVFMNVGTTGGGTCSHDCNPGLTDVHQ